jgi:hypothetical protein
MINDIIFFLAITISVQYYNIIFYLSFYNRYTYIIIQERRSNGIKPLRVRFEDRINPSKPILKQEIIIVSNQDSQRI